MSISIQVLSTSVETKPTQKGSYQQLEVAYKNLTFGKVESKKLMSFGAGADVFKVMATATAASVWDIEVVKNDKGFNDWVKATKGTAVSSVVDQPTKANVSSPAATKGGWETPEERAKKQIYIVRQSSISAAVNALSVGVKSPPKAVEVIEYARELEEYVFSTASTSEVVRQDVGSIEDLSEDVPF